MSARRYRARVWPPSAARLSGQVLLRCTYDLFMFVYGNETCESCAFAYSYDLGARQNKIAGSVTLYPEAA